MTAKNIEKTWNDIGDPSAFAGSSIINKNNPTLKKTELQNNILPKIPTYQKFRNKKRPKVYNPYFVYNKRTVIQSDLLHMLHPPAMLKANNGFAYILVVQDVFSRKIWVAALKKKSASSIVPELVTILKKMHPFQTNARLVIDRGTEYLNTQVRSILKKYKISISHPSDGHAAHVERAILSLQRILYQYIESRGGRDLNWTKILQAACNIMNNRYHRIIRMSPNNAEKLENKNKVSEAMSLYQQKAFDKQRKRKLQRLKFKESDFVRIQRWKNKFARGYSQNFTTEVFLVEKVLNHLPITMYTIKDLEDNTIVGNFYAEELSLVKGNVFLVEKIIKKKKIGKITWAFVKWEGFPPSYNTWEKEKDII